MKEVLSAVVDALPFVVVVGERVLVLYQVLVQRVLTISEGVALSLCFVLRPVVLRTRYS